MALGTVAVTPLELTAAYTAFASLGGGGAAADPAGGGREGEGALARSRAASRCSIPASPTW